MDIIDWVWGHFWTFVLPVSLLVSVVCYELSISGQSTIKKLPARIMYSVVILLLVIFSWSGVQPDTPEVLQAPPSPELYTSCFIESNSFAITIDIKGSPDVVEMDGQPGIDMTCWPQFKNPDTGAFDTVK
jgi:hypothetical protein